MWITLPFVAVVRCVRPQGGVDKVVCTCELLVGTSTFPQVIHNLSTGFSTGLSTGVEGYGWDQGPPLCGVIHRVRSMLRTSTTTTGGPYDSHSLFPRWRLCRARLSLDLGSVGDRSCCRGGGRDLSGQLGHGLSGPVGPSAAYQMGQGPWPAPRVPSPLRRPGRLSAGGLDTPVSGPLPLCLPTGTLSSSFAFRSAG